MRGRITAVVLLLLLTSSLSSAATNENPVQPASPTETPQVPIPQGQLTGPPWVDQGVLERIASGQPEVRVTVITRSLDDLDVWQYRHGAIEKQASAKAGEVMVGLGSPLSGIDHRTLWLDADLLHKLTGVPGVIAIIDAQRSPEPYGITPMESPPGHEPTSVRTGQIHGATDAWERGYTGDGLVVAVADTGVDFGHPDLNGTQARVEYQGSSYLGWPLMLDHNSMYHWLIDGEAYPQADTWYANTSATDFDNDSDGVLDSSGYNITGVNASLSGTYHLGEHPDWKLRDKAGGDVPILIVDDRKLGLYETVWPDIDRDGWFGNETPMRPGEETSGRDLDDDGLWDISAGLVYWVADGTHGAPYGSTYAARHGYNDRIPGSGNLTLFMLDSGNHGTLCASAVAAQGEIDGGRVLGMAPNATISSIGNHYSGGHALDAWRFIAEGYDGDPSTPDQPHIGSFSFGYSSVDDSGADGYSLYLDWLTRAYNPNASYAVAIGNGGHGFGTTKVPGAAHGVFSVGAFSSRSSDSWGQSAPWSNRGPNVVGRMDPDIVSVGWSATGDLPLNDHSGANESWTTWGGTSLATPVVAGLLALIEEAWLENLNQTPGSQELRDFVLSTSDDRGYEPFVQGGGWMNASRSVATLEGENGTWSLSPAQWNSGTFQGQHRDANLNSLRPGESQTVELSFDNPGDSDLLLSLAPTAFAPLEHTVLVWNSTGNGSSGGENDTWDGHQDDRPDLLIPLHIPSDPSHQLPPGTVQIRARATIDYAAFDPYKERSSKERVYLQVYRWTDYDGDGVFHNDSDGDGMVDDGEWNESGEMEEVTYWWSNGPRAEVRVGLPFEDARDGLMLGVWRYDGQLSGTDPVRIEVDWTAFGSVEDDWVSVPATVQAAAHSTTTVEMAVSVPEGAPPGLRQHGILIESNPVDGQGQPTGGLSRSWTLPVVTNVPWQGPFTLLPEPLDGNTSNQTLYTESWISGAMRWSWRAESGDWRFLTVEWPEELGGGGSIVLDVDWNDNPYTDIDVLWLTESPHGYAEDAPDAYGSSTFHIEGRSVNNHATSGQHNWGTYTGTSRETFVVPPTPGTHQMVLHTALHGVQTNDNPLNITVGYLAAEASGFQRTVTDWSEGGGNDTARIVSTIPLSVRSIEANGWSQPIRLENQTAYQDDSGDKMTASWWHNLSLEDASEISVSMDAYHAADLDLYLFHDADGDGNFSAGEESRRSLSSTSSESVSITDPEDGLYGIAVHGWSVDDESTGFWIDIDVVSGTALNVTGHNQLNASQISSMWPSGSPTLDGRLPAGALELNLSFDRPPREGTWLGFVDIELEGGARIRLPYEYELIETDPEISFTIPQNMTQTNSSLPIRLHARDIGIGFYLSDLQCSLTNSPSGPTRIPAESAWGVDAEGRHHNLTWRWNGLEDNIAPDLFREVWVNTSLPTSEQWFDYHANVTDASGRSAEAFLSVAYDATAPPLLVTGVPWITTSQEVAIGIQTEPGTTLSVGGTTIDVNESGFAQHLLQLEPSQAGYSEGSQGVPAFYHNGGSNVFSVSASDPAGNSASKSFQVVYDPFSPSEVEIISILDQAGYAYAPADLHHPMNLSGGHALIEIPADISEWCLEFTSVLTGSSSTECMPTPNQPVVLNASTGFPVDGVGDYPSTFVESIPLGLVTDLEDGNHIMRLRLTDWANNTHEESWPLVLDRTLPAIAWSLDPTLDVILGDHRQNLSWDSPEDVGVSISLNGLPLSEQSGSDGYLPFDLNRTGDHTICLRAVDLTEPQANDNRFSECRTFELPEITYDTALADGNGQLVALDSIEVVILRHESQPIHWSRTGSEETHLVGPGSGTVTLVLDLIEGQNEFVIQVDALDGTDTYTISLERDSTPPVLEFKEDRYRNAPLSAERQISGSCEPGLLVRIWSASDSAELVCPPTGNFTSPIGVPQAPGSHAIEASSLDAARNEQTHSIEVLKQDWSEWAIDDARGAGPMLGWLSLGVVLALAAIALPASALLREKSRGRVG